MIEETTHIGDNLDKSKLEKIFKEINERATMLHKKGHKGVKLHWYVHSQKAVLSYGNQS